MNFKKVMPLAMVKHQLHAMELKAQGTYTEQNWDGMLLRRGQNAPEMPKDFPPVGAPPVDGWQIYDAQGAYTYTQPYGVTTILHEGKLFHCRCNCTCRSCMTLCAEVPVKKAVKQRQSEENQAALQKEYEANLKKAEEEKATFIQGVTEKTAGRIALASIWCAAASGETPPPSPIPDVPSPIVAPVVAPVVAPIVPAPKPRFLSPNIWWPFVRCKAVFRALKPKEPRFVSYPIGNHKWLLNWLAKYFNLPLEEFKDKSLWQLAKEQRWRFSNEARTNLLSAYPPRSDIGRKLRDVFHSTDAQ
jgi:hypothetical protein